MFQASISAIQPTKEYETREYLLLRLKGLNTYGDLQYEYSTMDLQVALTGISPKIDNAVQAIDINLRHNY